MTPKQGSKWMWMGSDAFEEGFAIGIMIWKFDDALIYKRTSEPHPRFVNPNQPPYCFYMDYDDGSGICTPDRWRSLVQNGTVEEVK